MEFVDLFRELNEYAGKGDIESINNLLSIHSCLASNGAYCALKSSIVAGHLNVFIRIYKLMRKYDLLGDKAWVKLGKSIIKHRRYSMLSFCLEQPEIYNGKVAIHVARELIKSDNDLELKRMAKKALESLYGVNLAFLAKDERQVRIIANLYPTREEFINACREGRPQDVKISISAKFNVMKVVILSEGILEAVKAGHHHIVKLFMGQPISKESANESIYAAISRGYSSIAIMIIEKSLWELPRSEYINICKDAVRVKDSKVALCALSKVSKLSQEELSSLCELSIEHELFVLVDHIVSDLGCIVKRDHVEKAQNLDIKYFLLGRCNEEPVKKGNLCI